jgi:hypothetical protein
VITKLRGVQIEQEQPIPEVQAMLTQLADTLDGGDRASFDRIVGLIATLTAPESQFSVDGFIAGQVRDALQN